MDDKNNNWSEAMRSLVKTAKDAGLNGSDLHRIIIAQEILKPVMKKLKASERPSD